MKPVDGILAALADPTRRQVIELLRQRPRKASDLATAVSMSPPAMSRHLRMLRRSGLVQVDRDEEDARLRIFRLQREPFDELQTWLTEVRTFWTDQLEAFKARAESGAKKTGRKQRR